MNASLLKWDDFKIVLAIGNSNNLLGAAHLCKLSHATVFRRLSDIEERLGEKLFWRSRNGYFPTEVGEKVLFHAERIEGEISTCQRKINRQNISLDGSIRITTTDTLLYGMIGTYLTEFMDIHPKLKIEIITTNKSIDLSSRDADMAIRPVDSPKKGIVGCKVGSILQAFFTHKDNSCSLGGGASGLRFIGPDNEMQYPRLEKWFFNNGMNEQCLIKTNSLMSNYSLLKSGYGYAILPCYLGDQDPLLKRATDPIPELNSDLWILTHPDLRGTVKIQALMEFMFTKLTKRLSCPDENDIDKCVLLL